MTKQQQLTQEISSLFGTGHQEQFTKRMVLHILESAGVEELERAKEIIINHNKTHKNDSN